MLKLIFHGIGDYFLQTDFQALNKKKRTWLGFRMCLKHCITYSLPFLLIGSWKAVLVIFVTHFIIDRTNLVSYCLAWKNNVKKYLIHDQQGYLKETSKDEATVVTYDISNCGLPLDRPFAIAVWLNIISDNLLHLICNYFALTYL